MSWIAKEKAAQIDRELTALGCKTRAEISPYDRALARVKLTLVDPRGGNMVVREAEEDSVAADMLADAQRELHARGTKTARRIRAERQPT